MENKGAIQKGFGCVFWLLLAMSLIPAGVGSYYSWQEYQTLVWKKTTAKVVEGGYFHPEGYDSGRITVEYTLDGLTYRQPISYTFAQPAVLTDDLTTMRKYSFAAIVDVYFDPLEAPLLSNDNPQYYQRKRAVLKKGLSDDFYVPFIFSGVFFFGAFGFRRLSRGALTGSNKQ